MSERKKIQIYVYTTLIATLIINAFSSIPALWTLLLLPALGIIFMFPRWKISITVGIMINVFILGTEFIVYNGDIPSESLIRMILIGCISFLIVIVISYFRIRFQIAFMELEHLTLTDPLTKIHNRRFFDHYMETALSKQGNEPFTILLFDIDHFKSVNDTYGHNIGDLVLKRVARTITRIIYEDVEFVRLGGEEFVIILPNRTKNQSVALAEQIRRSVKSLEFSSNHKKFSITLSIGIAQYEPGETVQQLLDRADKALYQAKENGRDQVRM